MKSTGFKTLPRVTMDQSQISAMKAMGMITPTEFEALFKDKAELELVGIKNYARRTTIFEAVKTTNQDDMKEAFSEGDL